MSFLEIVADYQAKLPLDEIMCYFKSCDIYDTGVITINDFQYILAFQSDRFSMNEVNYMIRTLPKTPSGEIFYKAFEHMILNRSAVLYM